MKEMKNKPVKKGIVIFIAVAAFLLTAVGITLPIVFSRKEYRSIAVEDVKGSAIVVNEKNTDRAYKGQRLYGGDDVTVQKDSELTMCINNDKYLYADENTHFYLEDHSTKNSSRIRIILDRGSELNELTEKLNPNESYEVDTPNSTMSVRGTKFRVTVFTDTDGRVYTLLEVEEGIVWVQLKTVTGDYNGVEKEFYAGQSALIRADVDFSEFVTSENGDEVLTPDYNSLPEKHMDRLKALLAEAGVSDLAEQEPETGMKEEEEIIAETKTGEEKDVDETKEDDKKQEGSGKKESDGKKESGKSKENDGKKESGKKSSGSEKEETDNKTSATHTHTPGQFEVTVNPGCETKGKQVAKCTECGEITDTQDIDPLGHDFGSWTTIKEATCKEEGSESRKCARCGKEETNSIPVTDNHKWGNFKVDVSAGCTTDGEGHYICTVCGAEGEHETIPAKGHSFSGWTTVKEATCKAEGSESRKCSECSETQTRSIDKKDHKWSSWQKVESPTCSVDGKEERSCSICGEKESRSVPATGSHTWGNYQEDVPAGCMTDGEGHYTCTVCGAEGEHETIPAKGHNYEEVSKEKIDETTYKVTYRCKNCGSEYTATKKG